jgi:hypothetical protein
VDKVVGVTVTADVAEVEVELGGVECEPKTHNDEYDRGNENNGYVYMHHIYVDTRPFISYTSTKSILYLCETHLLTLSLGHY